MITETREQLEALTEGLAALLAATLPAAESLVAGGADRLAPAPLGIALVAEIGGPTGGELAVQLDSTLAAALQHTALGELDLAAALAPVFAQLAEHLDGLVLAHPEVVDPTSAAARLARWPYCCTAPLHGRSGVRATLSIALQDPDLQAAAGAPAHVRGGADPRRPGVERLDLLRGVEMAATVQLGRARMTVNDLLSLHDGAIVELDRAAGDAVDLLVNGRLLARGEVVVVDENYGLRITQIVTDEAR